MKNNELIVPSVSIQGSAQLIPFKTHRPWNIIKKALRGKSPVFVEEQNPFIFSRISHEIPWKNLKLDKSFHSLQIV